VRTDNATSAAYSAAGSGTTAPETFIAVDPSDPNSISPIQPGETTVLQSAQTGQYCRLAVLSPGTEQGMVCDQALLADATPLTYTGSRLSYQGVPLVSTAPGAPLVLANSTSAPLSASSDNLLLSPTGGRSTHDSVCQTESHASVTGSSCLQHQLPISCG
jgi:hypothetical protein